MVTFTFNAGAGLVFTKTYPLGTTLSQAIKDPQTRAALALGDSDYTFTVQSVAQDGATPVWEGGRVTLQVKAKEKETTKETTAN